MDFYNDNDPKVAAWLRELIAAGHLPPGDVSDASIGDISNELHGRRQVHFFAGIGGWPLALRLAAWPVDRPVWTGSCPCQPFSSAGKGLGVADERHLWPVMLQHIAEHRPATVFGEQVASGAGREWLAGVRADLEALGYAVGAADLCAAGVGAPHIRQRLYWVANTASTRRRWWNQMEVARREEPRGPSPHLRFEPWPDHAGSSSTLAVADLLAASYGVPGRMGLLRGYGNAIVPQLAATFVRAYLTV